MLYNLFMMFYYTCIRCYNVHDLIMYMKLICIWCLTVHSVYLYIVLYHLYIMHSYHFFALYKVSEIYFLQTYKEFSQLELKGLFCRLEFLWHYEFIMNMLCLKIPPSLTVCQVLIRNCNDYPYCTNHPFSFRCVFLTHFNRDWYTFVKTAFIFEFKSCQRRAMH